MANQTYKFLVTVNLTAEEGDDLPPEYRVREAVQLLPRGPIPAWMFDIRSVSVESVTVMREQQEQED